MLAALDRARLVQPTAKGEVGTLTGQQKFTLLMITILCIFALCLAAEFTAPSAPH